MIDVALDKSFVGLYLAGESVGEANYLFYAVRWTNAEFRLSHRARLGFGRTSRSQPIEPETWETVLLQCKAPLGAAVSGQELLEETLAAGDRGEGANVPG